MVAANAMAFAQTRTEPTALALRSAGRADAQAFERLSYLCDRIGPRVACSEPFLKAVRWAESLFKTDGQEVVRLEPVTTQPWVRGRERAAMLAPVPYELPMLGLGGSVATPTGGLEAPVVLVRSIAELGPQVKGKIVLFAPNIPEGASGGERYGIYAPLRFRGASRAAAFGAVAMLLRTAPVHSLGTPHTGMLAYDPGQPKIPAATVACEQAEWMARLLAQGQEVRVHLEMEAHSAGSVLTANVVSEIRGSDRPDEIVLIGAHLDSWDIGQGAQDDGVGVVQVVEALRLLKAQGLRPKRTIRAVLFVNEEHGLDGGRAYAAAHGQEKHVAAIECDSGCGMPRAWSVAGTPEQTGWFLQAAAPLGLPVRLGGGGSDLDALEAHGVLVGEMGVDVPEYFDVHHTHADTLDKVDPKCLREGTGAMAALAWQLANALDAPLPGVRK